MDPIDKNAGKNQSNQASQWTILFLVFAVVMGSFVRLYPTLTADFPLNDGGMFYTMIDDLRENNFIPPETTTYNSADIPFAYPPLSFFTAGLITELLGFSLLDVIRILPAIITVLTIPAFYFLAKAILKRSSTAVLATLAFAFLPRTFSWFILGGGVSRSFYLLFYLLAALFTYKLFQVGKTRKTYIFLASLFHLLTVLSHPEGAIHAATMGVFMFLMVGRNKAGIRKAVPVGSIVLIASSVWWLDVLLNHGLEPILSAMKTGGHTLLSIWYAFYPSFGEEPGLTVFSIFALIGLFKTIQKKDWLLVFWFVFPLIVEPRSAFAVSIIPFALLSGIGLEAILSAFFKQEVDQANQSWIQQIGHNRMLQAFLGYVIILGVINAFSFGLKLTTIQVSADEHQAMEWARENVSEDSKFLVLTGSQDPFADPVSEWFPAISERVSVNTIQGLEWTAGSTFPAFQSSLPGLQDCLSNRILCLKEWGQEHDRDFSYLFITRQPNSSGGFQQSSLINALTASEEYSTIYDNNDVIIFSRR